jgi:hypothetical protein
MRGTVYRHDIGHGLLWIRTPECDEDVICSVRALPKSCQPPEPGPFTGKEKKSLVGLRVSFSLLHSQYYKRATDILVHMGAFTPHVGALRS